ncbi:hypothetical protein vseg_005223 [Gypsophila vaccaria]
MSFKQNTLVIFALILLTCLISSPCIHGNDQKIVGAMCGATAVPAVCETCMNNLCGREILEDLDVIMCSIRCTVFDTDYLINNATDYASQSTDPKVKDVVLGCVADYNSTETSLMSTIDKIARRMFDVTKGIIDNQIYPKMRACTDSIKQSGIPYPPPLFGHGVIVSTDYQIMYQLLSVIKP